MISSLAPGSRIIARDEEWLVRRVDLTPSGAHLLTVTGLSPLVRNRESIFIDRVEALDEPIKLVEAYVPLEMWHETNAQKDGTIRRRTHFPTEVGEMIFSGRHIHVARPFYKSPQPVCDKHHDFDTLNLETLPDDYLPRTNYEPACEIDEYRRRTSTVPWDGKRITDFYRWITRKMLSQSGERTLISSIIPPAAGHIDGCFSIAFSNHSHLLALSAVTHSLPMDFWVKTTGKANFRDELASMFPLLTATPVSVSRTLALNCLTTHYAELWRECWDEAFRQEPWLGDDPRLDADFWRNLTPEWTRHCALRTDFARRWALVELDVLAARALGLTLAELQTIYRIQFPVMQQFEADTWYDQRGRIIFTNNSQGLPGVGLPRAEWNEVRALQSGTVKRTVTDTTLPTGPIEREITYHAPFTKCDRETDYATVWRKLEDRG